MITVFTDVKLAEESGIVDSPADANDMKITLPYLLYIKSRKTGRERKGEESEGGRKEEGSLILITKDRPNGSIRDCPWDSTRVRGLGINHLQAEFGFPNELICCCYLNERRLLSLFHGCLHYLCVYLQ